MKYFSNLAYLRKKWPFSGSLHLESSYQLFGKGSDTSFAFLRLYHLWLFVSWFQINADAQVWLRCCTDWRSLKNPWDLREKKKWKNLQSGLLISRLTLSLPISFHLSTWNEWCIVRVSWDSRWFGTSTKAKIEASHFGIFADTLWCFSVRQLGNLGTE